MYQDSRDLKAVAAFLKDHPAVAWVSYPALPGQEGEAMAARYVPQGPGSRMAARGEAGEDEGRRGRAATGPGAWT